MRMHISHVSRSTRSTATRRGEGRDSCCGASTTRRSHRSRALDDRDARELRTRDATHCLRIEAKRPAATARAGRQPDACRSRSTRRRGARAPSGGPAPRRRSVPPGQARRREAVDVARSRRVRVSSMWGAPSVRRQRDARWICGSGAYPCEVSGVRAGVGAVICIVNKKHISNSRRAARTPRCVAPSEAEDGGTSARNSASADRGELAYTL